MEALSCDLRRLKQSCDDKVDKFVRRLCDRPGHSGRSIQQELDAMRAAQTGDDAATKCRWYYGAPVELTLQPSSFSSSEGSLSSGCGTGTRDEEQSSEIWWTRGCSFKNGVRYPDPDSGDLKEHCYEQVVAPFGSSSSEADMDSLRISFEVMDDASAAAASKLEQEDESLDTIQQQQQQSWPDDSSKSSSLLHMKELMDVFDELAKEFEAQQVLLDSMTLEQSSPAEDASSRGQEGDVSCGIPLLSDIARMLEATSARVDALEQQLLKQQHEQLKQQQQLLHVGAVQECKSSPRKQGLLAIATLLLLALGAFMLFLEPGAPSGGTLLPT